VRLAERSRAAHIKGMENAILRRWAIGPAATILVPLIILTSAAALAQTNTQTIQRTLGNMQSLPPASDPYQRSTDEYLYRQQLRSQAQQSQGQAAQSQQQLIDESGQVLQQNLATQRQQQLQQQQQFYDYQLQSQQQRRIQQQH